MHASIQFLEIFFTASYLNSYNIQGSSLSFLKSYFQNRRKFIAYRGASSTVQKQDIGTIQGSKLGPCFLDIYSNDMNCIFFNDESVMCANDTTVAYVGSDLS